MLLLILVGILVTTFAAVYPGAKELFMRQLPEDPVRAEKLALLFSFGVGLTVATSSYYLAIQLSVVFCVVILILLIFFVIWNLTIRQI